MKLRDLIGISPGPALLRAQGAVRDLLAAIEALRAGDECRKNGHVPANLGYVQEGIVPDPAIPGYLQGKAIQTVTKPISGTNNMKWATASVLVGCARCKAVYYIDLEGTCPATTTNA